MDHSWWSIIGSHRATKLTADIPQRVLGWEAQPNAADAINLEPGPAHGECIPSNDASNWFNISHGSHYYGKTTTRAQSWTTLQLEQ